MGSLKESVNHAGIAGSVKNICFPDIRAIKACRHALLSVTLEFASRCSRGAAACDYCGGGSGTASFSPVKSGVMRRMVTRRFPRSGPSVGIFKYCSP
jgi:hypothetical protein